MKSITLLVAICLASLAATAADVKLARPNIIFILADDFGWGDVSCYGDKVPTPALDRMAKEGTRFRQVHVASPSCLPSRF